MKLQQLQSRLWMWAAALALGAMLLAPMRARAAGTVVFTVSSTTLSATGTTAINIYAQTIGSTTALSGNSYTLEIQVGDGGPWGNPNLIPAGGEGTVPQRSDADGPVFNTSAGSVQPVGSIFNGDTFTSGSNKPVDPVGQSMGIDPSPSQSEVYLLSGSFSSAKAAPVAAPQLLATVLLDGSDLPAGVYGQTYNITLFGTANGSSLFGSVTSSQLAGPGKGSAALPNEVLPALSTPEPASIALIGVLLPGLLLRRRRRAA